MVERHASLLSLNAKKLRQAAPQLRYVFSFALPHGKHSPAQGT